MEARNLAYLIFRDQDVPCSKVSVDEGLVGQVGHPRGHLSTVTQEGVVIYADIPFFSGPHMMMEKMFS